MDIDRLVSSILDYIQANVAGSVAAGIILLYIFVKKPKLFLILIVIAVVAYGVMNIFSRLSDTGLG